MANVSVIVIGEQTPPGDPAPSQPISSSPALACGHSTDEHRNSVIEVKKCLELRWPKGALCNDPDVTAVLYCRDAKGMIDALTPVVAKYGRIDRLDVVDHGDGGRQCMGDDREMFSASGMLYYTDGTPRPMKGLETARLLVPLLAETAQVRLLGCCTAMTANGRFGRTDGRMLLLGLAAALGGYRIVFGSIDRVESADYDPNGILKPDAVARLLFASVAALDIPPPTPEERALRLFGAVPRPAAVVVAPDQGDDPPPGG